MAENVSCLCFLAGESVENIQRIELGFEQDERQRMSVSRHG